jgi:hypothetical protein
MQFWKICPQVYIIRITILFLVNQAHTTLLHAQTPISLPTFAASRRNPAFSIALHRHVYLRWISGKKHMICAINSGTEIYYFSD